MTDRAGQANAGNDAFAEALGEGQRIERSGIVAYLDKREVSAKTLQAARRVT